MAVKQFVRVDSNKGVHRGDILGYWDLAAGDTAAPLICPRFSDRSVHIMGNFAGGASITMQGSNDPALGTYDDIYDFEGTVITQAAARKPWVILPNMYAIKPVLTGGNGSTAIRVAVMGRGEN